MSVCLSRDGQCPDSDAVYTMSCRACTFQMTGQHELTPSGIFSPPRANITVRPMPTHESSHRRQALTPSRALVTRSPISMTISALAAGSTAYYLKGVYDDKIRP